ncbi:hypothetical protein BDV32DRAFT_143285 [Aspergillus pseudonomiae]|nr:hypothetical protein BDV32DRAFT_143285 [Aspergillus pseudonomiae]
MWVVPRMIQHKTLHEVHPVFDRSRITVHLYYISSPSHFYNPPIKFVQKDQICLLSAPTSALTSKYCYAKVTADVSRKDGYTIFYPACGTLLAKGKWEIFYREELVTFDETLDENKHIMCVLVNSDGHTPTEVEVLRSFRKVLQEANEAILNLNKQKWEALEKVFDAAEKHGLREFQYLICEAFESLYKVDMSVDDNIL